MQDLLWTVEPGYTPQTEEEKIEAELFGNRAPTVFVAIFESAREDADATERDGRPRFVNVPYVAIRPKGERDYVSRPVSEEDKRRFPRAWASWTARQAAQVKPSVALLPGIRPAALRELEALGLRDVEQLAAYEGPLGDLEEFRTLAKRLASLSKPRMRLVNGSLEAVA